MSKKLLAVESVVETKDAMNFTVTIKTNERISPGGLATVLHEVGQETLRNFVIQEIKKGHQDHAMMAIEEHISTKKAANARTEVAMEAFAKELMNSLEIPKEMQAELVRDLKNQAGFNTGSVPSHLRPNGEFKFEGEGPGLRLVHPESGEVH